MKTTRLFWTICVLLVFCGISCAPNVNVLKKQEKASRNLGEAYMVKGDYTAALREFLKAEKIYAKDAYLQYDLGITYMAKERCELAIRHFKKALEIKTDYAPAKNALGVAYISRKEWDAAIRIFKELNEDLLYATPHYSLTNLGWAYYNKREYGLAEKYYRDALKIEPAFVIAQRGLAKTYVALGRDSDAVAILEKAVKNNPDLAQLYFDLGQVHTSSRDYNEALRSYAKAIELSPDSLLAQKAEKEAERIKRAW